MNQLEEIRAQMGACDDRIIAALEERMGCIEEIIAFKRENGVPIFQPEQEARQRGDWDAKLADNAYRGEIEHIFEAMVKSSKRIQSKTLVQGNIMLIGFMGVGKSTVSTYLCEMLAMDRVEMDAEIVAKEGMSIPEIFATHGEAYFRNCESNLLIELQKKSQQVVSCGGGVVLRPENVAVMRQSGTVVLLTASPESIYDRVKDSTDRPLLNGNMNIPYIEKLMEERRPRYEAAADVVVNTDDTDIQSICEKIIAAPWKK